MSLVRFCNLFKLYVYVYRRAIFLVVLWNYGSLKPKALTQFLWNSEVKPPMAGMVLGWVTFLALDFWRTRYSQATMWEPRGLPLGEIGASCLVHAHSSCSPLKGGPLILVMPILGLHRDFNQLKNEATSLIHASDNIIIFFLSLFLALELLQSICLAIVIWIKP